MENIDDPKNLTGLSTLVNKKHVNDKIDLDKLEQSMVGAAGIKIINEGDPAKEFKDTIRDLSDNTGINLMDDSDASEPTKPRKSKKPHYSESASSELDNATSGSVSEDSDQSKSFYSESSSVSSKSSKSSKSSRKRKERKRPKHKHKKRSDKYDEYLDDVINAYVGRSSDINVEREREEDTKAALLEDIDELLAELESDGVNVTRIPSVNQDSSIDLIKKTHKILRMKYDRIRCNTLGKEAILAAAQGMEYVCDGKRKIGPFQPDLTGWPNTVRTKLARMRYETSHIVSNIMQAYKLGPYARLFAELIPSMFLYSRMRKVQHGQSNYTPEQMSQAFDDLREFDRT